MGLSMVNAYVRSIGRKTGIIGSRIVSKTMRQSARLKLYWVFRPTVYATHTSRFIRRHIEIGEDKNIQMREGQPMVVFLWGIISLAASM